MDWDVLICMGSVLFLVNLTGLVANRHRWRVINYICQKVHYPNLKPPKVLKFWDRAARYSAIVFIIGLGVLMLYPLVLAGQIVAASCVAGFIALIVISMLMVNSYWKDHFDL